MNITVLTWNIWQGKNLPEIISYLKKADADIIGLQEVTEQTTDGKTVNNGREIAEALGMQYAYFTAFTNDRKETVFDQGNAVLSKYPISSSEKHVLSGMELYRRDAATEPRIAVEALIDIHGKTVSFFTTHLSFSADLAPTEIKKLQAANLAKVLPAEKAIVTGDFNSIPGSEVLRIFSGGLVNADEHPDAPTWTVYPAPKYGIPEAKLFLRLDNILVTPDIKVISCTVGDSKASDHLPVAAVLEI